MLKLTRSRMLSSLLFGSLLVAGCTGGDGEPSGAPGTTAVSGGPAPSAERASSPAAATTPREHYRSVEQYVLKGEFKQPEFFTVDGSGKIYLLDGDSKGARVLVFGPDGALLRSFGEKGKAEGALNYPKTLRLARDGNLLINQSYDVPIQKFDPNGKFLARFGTFGKEPLQLPSGSVFGMDIDAAGNFYVVVGTYGKDAGVRKLDPTGKGIATFGKAGKKPGEFKEPRGVALDGKGNIFVADRGNGRVQKLAPDGSFLTAWGKYGHRHGEFGRAEQLAVDEGGHVFVCDSANERVQKFDNDGKWLATFGSHGLGAGELDSLMGVALRGADVVTVERASRRVQIWRRSAQAPEATVGEKLFLAEWPLSADEADRKARGTSFLAVAPSGELLAANEKMGCVIRFSAEGKEVGRFGKPGDGEAEFGRIGGLAVDKAGNVYVSDRKKRQIFKFDSAGKLLLAFGSRDDKEDGKFKEPAGIAVDGAGNIYVCDSYKFCAFKFDPTGKYLARFGTPREGRRDGDDGVPSYPRSVVVDGKGEVYLTDKNNHQVHKFAADGKFLLKFGKSGIQDGGLAFPEALAIDSKGNLYTADQQNRVQKFDGKGAFLGKFGKLGSEGGFFYDPQSLAVASDGTIYVVDKDLRIQKFRPMP